MSTRPHSLLPLLLAVPLLLLFGCPAEEPTPTVSIDGAHSVQIGMTLSLSASTADGTDASYTWSSMNEDIATVDAAGLVTGVALGEATIMATGADTAAFAHHAVVVTAEPVEFDTVVTVSGAFYVRVGETADLSATTINGTDSGYAWSVDDESLASVDESGLFTAREAGEVVVTATGNDSGVSGTLGVVTAYDIPNYDAWMGSGHSDRDAEAFNHWNDDGEIPTSCARCHSTPGYRDYIGDDGTAADQVDNAAALGTVIECEACHNPTTATLDHVTFPSGVTIEGLGAEARCMTCHQGRASSVTVNDAIAAAGVGDDEVSGELGFINIHYYAAGATLNAGRVMGGYQYDGQVYDVRFRHVPEKDVCIECHDPHSLEVRFDDCQDCHEGVTDGDEARAIRMMSSAHTDYDGDNDLDEGVYGEMVGMRGHVMDAIQAYANELGSPICYDGHAYPYFFLDTDSSGECEAGEANFGNRFNAWTPRLLRAAYNFQVASKDPGAFAHNAKYIIELLYDSATDLNGALSTALDFDDLVRNDPGHFNGSGEPARYWDENEEVSASCSRCHGASEGLRFFLEHGVGTEVLEQGNGLDCATCHETFGIQGEPDTYTVIQVDAVVLADGNAVSVGNGASNLCGTCHAGRKVGADVDRSGSFQNVHYLPAAGVKLGSDGGVGYEYDGESYAATWNGHPPGNECATCHQPALTEHTFHPEDAVTFCDDCHAGISSVHDIRKTARKNLNHDYDGDGDFNEPLSAELAAMADGIYDLMTAAAAICYESHSYPYWFKDTNNDGLCQTSEANFGNRFTAFTDELKRAAYNYQVWAKEPGAWAHNMDYMGQLLYDTHADLGGTGFKRP